MNEGCSQSLEAKEVSIYMSKQRLGRSDENTQLGRINKLGIKLFTNGPKLKPAMWVSKKHTMAQAVAQSKMMRIVEGVLVCRVC